MKLKFGVPVFAAFFSMALHSGVTFADDTEIFFNRSETSIRPNLMFVLDNSGSMDATVRTVSTYDPDFDYSGEASDAYFYYYDYQVGFVPLLWEANRCADLESRLASSGRVLDYRIATWRGRYAGSTSERWRNLSTDWRLRQSDNVLECYSDRGTHGATEGSGQTYANDKNQWTNNERHEIDWSDISRQHLYSANYVNWYREHREETEQTRLEIVKSVAKNLIDSLTGVNVGLMAFNPDDNFPTQGGRVYVPVGKVEDVRDDFKAAVDGLGYDTNTPLSETLFGSMRYFAGEEPYLDDNPVAGTVADGKYVSPVEYECQSNNVIFLTDGEPTYDGEPTNDGYHEQEMESRAAMESRVGNCSGNCMDEVADYMNNSDITSGDDMDVNVSTYTVGFDLDLDLLDDAARKGGGEFFLVNDAESLETAFTDVVSSVLAVSTTYVAPGVAVNTFNRLNHLDSLYFSVFQPELSQNWDGNLKRYRLGSDGVIYDVNGDPATDPDTGFFRNGSRSWWSDEDDGPDVSKGGAASVHPATNSLRDVYTYLSAAGNTDLTVSANSVDASNTNLTKALLGDESMSDDDRDQIINWARGADVFDENRDGQTADSREYIADPLHSVPHLVIYGGSSESPDTTIFFGDNQGYIHAIDGDSGDTYFSFIPEELLDNQRDLMDDSTIESGKIYGMDSSVISWQHDDDRDGQIDGTDGDHVYIYAGMRRGGHNYYALDVTNRDVPKMLWTIEGGTGDFAELGQSWSVPVKTKIRIGKNLEDVLIFAGGYDTQQDTVTERTEDSVGRALYIVDAETGARLWWAGPVDSGANLELEELKYSIPSAVKAIDATGDGGTDQIYVGDMGGQVWRFDIMDGEKASDIATGGVIADLAGDDSASNRRFYHAPDLFGEKIGGVRHLGLVIGSGWQAHPLDNVVEDRIYKLQISDVVDPPAHPPEPNETEGEIDYSLAKVTEADLYDTTGNLIGQGDEDEQAQAQTELAAADGWYIRMVRAGEKVLSTSQTVNGELFFTTFEPKPNANPCIPSSGTSRLYHIYVADGQPVVNYDGLGSDTELTVPDREVTLNTLGLPPDPQRMRVDGKDVVCVGAECFPVDSLTGVVETYWYED
ncbi:pilus assembly protein [Marinobacter sp. GN3S48]|uniref:pilus assembly protein n=1 Tax=Marinobacter sp. GN3S48 TaxID=3382302 RepID=UPI00387B8067